MNRAIPIPFSNPGLRKPNVVTRYTPRVDRHAVREQVARVVASDGFIRAPRMRRFLTYVVEETLAGRAGQLCEYSVGVSVFERDESFDPTLDPIVRNDARRLRQKLLEFYHSPGAGTDDLVIEIPKGGYVPVFRSKSATAVSKNDGQYRLIARLIRVSDGAQVWATEQLLGR